MTSAPFSTASRRRSAFRQRSDDDVWRFGGPDSMSRRQHRDSTGARLFASVHRLQPSDEPPHGSRAAHRRGAGAASPEHEELSYRVELWNAAGEVVEQTLAVTSSSSIGYAAYYAATREFPDAVITLRHNTTIMSRWGGRPN